MLPLAAVPRNCIGGSSGFFLFSRSIQINKDFVGHELGSQHCPTGKGRCLLNFTSSEDNDQLWKRGVIT